jgi:hypothetical protein
MKKTKIDIFEVGIERLDGPSHYVYYQEPTLYFQKLGINNLFSPPEDQIITNPDWDAFFNTMEPYHIWRINKEYGSNLLAMLWWHINIRTNSQEIISCGINIFPDQKTESESSFYRALKYSLNKIIGENVF